jgi:hypothetical protein
MQRIDLLLVGDATDGPVEEIIPIDSLDEAWRLFGGYQYEYTSIASGSTGYTLSTTPWANEVTPLKEDSDGFLIPQRLFEFTVDGASLSWTSPGASSNVIFRISQEPGATSLLKGVLAARKTGLRVHVVRLGGTVAASAPSGGFTFYARHAGSRYNGTQIVVTSGGAVTVVPSGGIGRNRTYTLANDRELYDTLRTEVQKGFQGTLIKGSFSESSFTVPAGTYTLTDGTDGSLSAEAFNNYLRDEDLSGVDVVCPVGLLTTALSGAGVFDTITQNDYPTLIVAQAPNTGVLLSGTIIESRHLCSVGFKVRYDFGLLKERLDDAAPLVGALVAGSVFGHTLRQLPEFPAEPKYDQLGLHVLAASGHTVAFRSISKDWALWHANTGDPLWPVSTFRALQEIARIVFENLEPIVGNTLVSITDLDQILEDGFAAVEGSRIVDWELLLQGDILYLDISFTPHGEIRVVKTQLALGQDRAVSPV